LFVVTASLAREAYLPEEVVVSTLRLVLGANC
jgi:hypothetical protein